MIIGILGHSEKNPVEDLATEERDPVEDGYVVTKTVDWPSVDPGTIKNRLYTGPYPADPNLEGYREELESPEHEASESKETEEKEHY